MTTRIWTSAYLTCCILGFGRKVKTLASTPDHGLPVDPREPPLVGRQTTVSLSCFFWIWNKWFVRCTAWLTPPSVWNYISNCLTCTAHHCSASVISSGKLFPVRYHRSRNKPDAASGRFWRTVDPIGHDWNQLWHLCHFLTILAK